MSVMDTLRSAVSRSNMAEGGQPSNWAAIAQAAIEFVPEHSDTVVELSKVGLHKTPEGRQLGTEEAFLFLFPSHFVIARNKGLISKRVDVQGSIYGEDIKSAFPDEQEFGTDGKSGEFAIQFAGAGNVPLFRIAWSWFRGAFANPSAVKLPAATERDRILSALQRLGL